MTTHTVTLTKIRREPLDPHWQPTCACGWLGDVTDIDGAKSQRSRHEARMAGASADGGEVR